MSTAFITAVLTAAKMRWVILGKTYAVTSDSAGS